MRNSLVHMIFIFNTQFKMYVVYGTRNLNEVLYMEIILFMEISLKSIKINQEFPIRSFIL